MITGVSFHVLCVSHVIIDPNPSINLSPRFIYFLMMTQVESKRLNYEIDFRNSLKKFNYEIVFRNSLTE